MLLSFSCTSIISPSECTSPESYTPESGSPGKTPPVEQPMMEPETPEPTFFFQDPRSLLEPGNYFTYWKDSYLFIQGLDSTAPTRLMPYRSLNRDAKISPDGNKIAFVTLENQIGIYDMTDGSLLSYPILDAEYVFSLDWSPDSQSIIFGGLLDNEYLPEFARFAIYAIQLYGNLQPVKLIGPDHKFIEGGYSPRFSPDGNWVSFIGKVMTPNYFVDEEYYVFNTACIIESRDCSAETHFITDYSQAYWLADDELIYSCTIEEQHSLCVVDVSELDASRVILDIRESTGIDDLDLLNMSVSLDSKYLAATGFYNMNDGEILKDIFLFLLDAKDAYNITNTPDTQMESGVGWSMDNHFLAIERNCRVIEDTYIPGYWQTYCEIIFIDILSGETIPLNIDASESKVFNFWMRNK